MNRKHTVRFMIIMVAYTIPILASNGAIPIWEPKTITEPGHYVLTRNITSSEYETIICRGVSNVHIDLNGFTVENTYSGQGYAIYVSDSNNVKITNGKVKGYYGVYVYGFSKGVEITHLQISDTTYGIYYQGQSHIISNNLVHDPLEIGIFSSSLSLQSFLSSNLVEGAGDVGIRVSDLRGGKIYNNIVHDSNTGLLLDDVRYSHIEGNVLTENQTGILMESTTHNNLLRKNTARGNVVDYIDSGTGNTSHGDNYIPNKM